MKWSETIASKCRWSKLADAALGLSEGWEILWENSESDYQGHADIFAKSTSWGDSRYLVYSWTYGSCSGCDGWEDQTRESIIREMLDTALFLSSKSELERYLDGLKKENPPSKLDEYDDWDMKGKIHAMELAIKTHEEP